VKLHLKPIRRLSPALYIRMNIARIDRDIQKLKGNYWGRKRTVDEENSISRLLNDRHEFEEWQQGLEDKELAKKAARIGVYLDEIKFTPVEEDMMFPRNYGLYYYSGTFGNELFRDEFRVALRKAVRLQNPVYRKEQREIRDLNIRLVGALSAALTGLIGAAIGLFSTILRHH
jgi:hypothetical protein